MSDKLLINLLVNLQKVLQAACQDFEKAQTAVFKRIFKIYGLCIENTVNY